MYLQMLLRKHFKQRDLTAAELQEECHRYIADFTVTLAQSNHLEQATRNQATSAVWHRYRIGRVTSSIAHKIKSAKTVETAQNCLTAVMRETADIGHVKSVMYGQMNENTAKTLYQDIQKSVHENFELRNCGLVIDTTFPLFAASPDGVRTCKCHGEGLLEVKCSYKHREQFVKDIPSIDPTFYLDKDSLKLKCTHSYYTQV